VGTIAQSLGVTFEPVQYVQALEFWLINPDTAQVEVYRLQDDAEVPHVTLRKHQTLTTPLFPGLEIPLQEVFRQ
jgi:Uma2 family endonuclease